MQAYGEEKCMKTTKEIAWDYINHTALYLQCEVNYDGKVKYTNCPQAEVIVWLHCQYHDVLCYVKKVIVQCTIET
jgi:hypothetical protein